MTIFLVLVIIGAFNNVVIAQQRDIPFFKDSNYTIIPFTSSQTWIFEKAKPATLDSNEIKLIKFKLMDCIYIYNQQRLLVFMITKKTKPTVKEKDFLIDLEEYKIQLIPVLNAKGEKEVWVNSFCRTNNIDWKKNIIQVDDGGKCYFTLKINLSTKKYYAFIVNGQA